MNLAEHRRQHVLARHPVDQPAGHQHVDQRGVGHREHRDERQDVLDRQSRRTGLDDLDERGFAFLQRADRNQRDRHDGDEDVDQPGDSQTSQQHLRKGLHRILGLLGHVHRVLEADHGEERQRCRGGDGHEPVLVAGGVECDDAGEIHVASAGEGEQANRDHQHQAGDLDDGQDDVELDTLTYPTQVHHEQQQHENQSNDDDSRCTPVDVRMPRRSWPRRTGMPSTRR